MLQHLLREKYHIDAENEFMFQQYEACIAGNKLYLLIPIRNKEIEEIMELDQIAKHLSQYGDKNVCQFLLTNEGGHVVKWRDERFSVIVNSLHNSDSYNKKIGRKLAKFHHRGRTIPFQMKKINRIGKWREYWGERLDQMEKVWSDHLFDQPEDEFEKMFLESYPYYMGLAENAIQYLTDTELDTRPLPIDSGTVCHIRFSSRSWGDKYTIKNPFDWVFDHFTRDLAEWTRETYFKNIKTYVRSANQFYSDYQSFSPLSPFAWRLLYARLLFPLHFFECVEGYYSARSEQQKYLLQERLKKYLDQTEEHEHFLSSFFELAEVPVRKYHIPKPEWLY